ncbi:MAG: DEAD/DEAH box helicase [Planctomycetia bacterium]|nr:DEAD/DEAH box helicase [Planctomycetia bacterium]
MTFESLGLTKPVLEALVAEGYTEPTPIQAKAVPHVLAGRDLFGCAQTGTGKTAAFALPLIERMLAKPQQPGPRRCRVLVLAPTRELAGQIYQSFRAYGKNANVKSAVIYGGVNQRPQAAAMMRGVDVLVATPGRLLDLINQRLVDIRAVEFLVLDEALFTTCDASLPCCPKTVKRSFSRLPCRARCVTWPIQCYAIRWK